MAVSDSGFACCDMMDDSFSCSPHPTAVLRWHDPWCFFLFVDVRWTFSLLWPSVTNLVFFFLVGVRRAFQGYLPRDLRGRVPRAVRGTRYHLHAPPHRRHGGTVPQVGRWVSSRAQARERANECPSERACVRACQLWINSSWSCVKLQTTNYKPQKKN